MNIGNEAMERAISQAIELIDRLPEVEPNPAKWPEKLAVIRRVLRGGLVVAEAANEEDEKARAESGRTTDIDPKSR